ncbi:hypothetical protein DY000_02015446 [Brassica cretica]|uniref:Uncharacterized protein n=1 Tax=Brassica cretica TaxID=69181 RepID=A0ABQ7D8W6_BRACR|nr:hypothetical protein DY000_02015446 [Brassica cretica]
MDLRSDGGGGCDERMYHHFLQPLMWFFRFESDFGSLLGSLLTESSDGVFSHVKWSPSLSLWKNNL